RPFVISSIKGFQKDHHERGQVEFATIRWRNFADTRTLRNLDQRGMLSACSASDDVCLYAGSIGAEIANRTTTGRTSARTGAAGVSSPAEKASGGPGPAAASAGRQRQDGMGKRIRRPIDRRVGRRIV